MIGPKRYNNNNKLENIINELHDWIEKHPCVIPSPNVSESIFVKVNVNILKKQNHLPQILVHELHNDLILPISQGAFYVHIN